MIPQITGYSYSTNFQFDYTNNDNPIIEYKEVIVVNVSDIKNKS